jgi:hypothetical protein
MGMGGKGSTQTCSHNRSGIAPPMESTPIAEESVDMQGHPPPPAPRTLLTTLPWCDAPSACVGRCAAASAGPACRCCCCPTLLACAPDAWLRACCCCCPAGAAEKRTTSWVRELGMIKGCECWRVRPSHLGLLSRRKGRHIHPRTLTTGEKHHQSCL